MAREIQGDPSTPRNRCQALINMGRHRAAMGIFLRADACQGHNSSGWVVLLTLGRELPFCVDCHRPSRYVQALMQETR